MRRVLAAVLVALALACTPASAAKKHIHAPIESIQPLQFRGANFCTAFSINEKAGFWATAGHCAIAAAQVWEKTGEPVTIHGELATIIYVDMLWDIAVFQGERGFKALPLGHGPLVQGEGLTVIGYPYGIARTVTKGWIGARNITIVHPSTGYLMTSDLLDVTVAGGNSGSPVLNEYGQVVGILWGAFNASSHSLSVPWEALVAVLHSYWG